MLTQPGNYLFSFDDGQLSLLQVPGAIAAFTHRLCFSLSLAFLSLFVLSFSLSLSLTLRLFGPSWTLQRQPSCLRFIYFLDNSLKGLVCVVDPARMDQVSAS